jgi:hypothetical protein
MDADSAYGHGNDRWGVDVGGTSSHASVHLTLPGYGRHVQAAHAVGLDRHLHIAPLPRLHRPEGPRTQVGPPSQHQVLGTDVPQEVARGQGRCPLAWGSWRGGRDGAAGTSTSTSTARLTGVVANSGSRSMSVPWRTAPGAGSRGSTGGRQDGWGRATGTVVLGRVVCGEGSPGRASRNGRGRCPHPSGPSPSATAFARPISPGCGIVHTTSRGGRFVNGRGAVRRATSRPRGTAVVLGGLTTNGTAAEGHAP